MSLTRSELHFYESVPSALKQIAKTLEIITEAGRAENDKPTAKEAPASPIAPGVYIVSPDDGSLHTIEYWRNNAGDPTCANLVAIVTEAARFVLAKKVHEARVPFKEAQEVAAEYTHIGYGPFRCPTRKEAIDIYDARFKGLDKALELIGGDKIPGSWYWTCESDTDPEYYSSYAFIYRGNYGYVIDSYKYHSYAVRPVSAF